MDRQLAVALSEPALDRFPRRMGGERSEVVDALGEVRVHAGELGAVGPAVWGASQRGSRGESDGGLCAHHTRCAPSRGQQQRVRVGPFVRE